MMQYWYFLPTVIYFLAGIFVFFMWIVGTDWYDSFELELSGDSFAFLMCHYAMNVVFGAVSIVGLYHNHPEPGYVWNIWIGVIVLAMGLVKVAGWCSSINKFFLKKRGKL